MIQSTDMPPTCPTPRRPIDDARIKRVTLAPQTALADYLQGMQLANRTADDLLGNYMLLSWYDRDRNFESPQHAGECHQQGAVPGYVDYGIHHGATLVVDIEDGRFVFYYLPVDL
ncbi:MAG: AF1514 family protein [Chromatiaceae bacterium]|nr:AF1514 family protein [Chromatiaceae bacterium]MCP5446918.1 AF1514 family protein [Chromatiaceae bacterium]